MEYTYDADAVERIAYSEGDRRVYAIGTNHIHVINLSSMEAPVIEHSVNLRYSELHDVALCGDYVFVTAEAIEADKLGQGWLMVFRKYNPAAANPFEQIHSIPVGTKPEMVKPWKNCQMLISLEGDPYTDNNGTIQDPEGAFIIVSFPSGVEGSKAPTVEKLDFRKFNSRIGALTDSGVRFVYRLHNNEFSNDVEPEYITVDKSTGTAYVTLQENNAVAEVDIAGREIKHVHGLHSKQWSFLDASDQDDGIRISYWPIRAWYMPDAAEFYSWKGRRLVFTSNEGDAKEEADFQEERRGKEFDQSKLDKTKVPQFVRDALTDDSKLGRLVMSSIDGKYENGTYHTLYTYGGRSFSIWDADNAFKQLYDSGSHIEMTMAMHCPHLFNANYQRVVDSRSDRGGPETESIALVEMNNRLYIFVGNERPGTISVYSIGDNVTSVRFESIYCDGIPATGTMDTLYAQRKLHAVDPETILYLDANASPTGYPVLLVAGAVSGTVSILKLEGKDVPSGCEYAVSSLTLICLGVLITLICRRCA